MDRARCAGIYNQWSAGNEAGCLLVKCPHFTFFFQYQETKGKCQIIKKCCNKYV